MRLRMDGPFRGGGLGPLKPCRPSRRRDTLRSGRRRCLRGGLRPLEEGRVRRALVAQCRAIAAARGEVNVDEGFGEVEELGHHAQPLRARGELHQSLKYRSCSATVPISFRSAGSNIATSS